jgi:hypothetical protein
METLTSKIGIKIGGTQPPPGDGSASNVGGHDHHGVGEGHHAALGISQPGGLRLVVHRFHRFNRSLAISKCMILYVIHDLFKL